MTDPADETLKELSQRQNLINGNHDIFKSRDYEADLKSGLVEISDNGVTSRSVVKTMKEQIRDADKMPDMIWVNHDYNEYTVIEPEGTLETKYHHARVFRRMAEREKRLVEALKEIAKGKGRYEHNRFEHACNTIDDMKELATEALSEHEKETGE